MAGNPVTTQDIEARWRSLTDDEITVAGALIEDVWAMALVQASSLSDDIDEGTITEDLVRAVLAAAVVRVMRNPEGLRQEQIDDYSWTRDTTLSAGALYLTDAEVTLLRGATLRRAVSMQLTGRHGGVTNW